MESFTTGTGQEIEIHDRSQCEGNHCVYHNPSGHHMREWKTHQRLDGFAYPLVERICPGGRGHGIGHPDPDSVAFLEANDERGKGTWDIHGCCGCCLSPQLKEKD